MAFRGQRFRVDLDSDEQIDQQSDGLDRVTTCGPWSLVADIQERSPASDPKPPSPPKIKTSQRGFPAHKKRSKSSASKQGGNRARHGDGSEKHLIPEVAASQARSTEGNPHDPNERQEIDVENRQRIAEMSSEDIENAREELLTGLSPSLIERLLKRAKIEEDQEANSTPKSGRRKETLSTKVSSSRKIDVDVRGTGAAILPRIEDTALDYPAPSSFHFPRAPTPPSLDPEDPEFLSKLHSTYFPTLPSNPNALSWMQPPDPAETEAYSPSLDNLLPSAVRFDFRGRLLPPRLASQIPPTKGLHHHGSAPEAAGYTIPELAHLSRSSFPSQRCIAYQTLGRILYRLGTGVFGPEDHELCQGLWKCIQQGRVLDILTAEAARDGDSGNRSCWVTATEAVWLWRKGGGRKWKAT
ncbi:MAG: hypothetical protein Q9166_000724 [cf. Caloplaca sp. 2 TL-2023]